MGSCSMDVLCFCFWKQSMNALKLITRVPLRVAEEHNWEPPWNQLVCNGSPPTLITVDPAVSLARFGGNSGEVPTCGCSGW